MANFSVSQNRQMYVASAYNASVNSSSAVGTLGAVKCINDGLDKEFYFMYKGALDVIKSDRISLKNLKSAEAISAADMIMPLKKVKVVLDSNINGGAPVGGKDYVLGINFKNFFSMGDDSVYFKDAAVHATTDMTAAQFYTAMKNALDKAFSREGGASNSANPYVEITADDNGLYIQEKIQDWALGIKKQRRICFDVQPSTIYTNGDDVIWGVVTDITPAKSAVVAGTTGIGNGCMIADLEWFCMGERGDQYRLMGYPNYIPTQYLVDPSKEYHVLELHYAFTDTGVNSYRSEKDITIAVPKGDSGAEFDVINAIIGAINTATGLSIPTLS